MSVILCLCMLLPLLSAPSFAAATNISVDTVSYYENGDVESINVKFGWNTASANSRMTVMTKYLRSAGEAGTNKTYGDFTNLGYYGKCFSSWDKVLDQSSTFGMLYYTEEQQIKDSKTNTITLLFDEGDISLSKNQTYYLYLWTYYQGHYYPDNLFMVLQVKDGAFSYAPATGRNSYGSFTPLWELTNKPSGSDNNSNNSSGSVSLVRATVAQPKEGNAPDLKGSLPSTASTTIQEVEWVGVFDENDRFLPGEAYTVRLTIGMKPGQNKIFNITASGVRINGKNAKLESVSADKKQIVISYTFPKLSASTITNFAITFPDLVVGSAPPTASQTKVSNSSIQVKDVEWVSDYDGATFVDNKDYTVYVTVGIKDGVNATFNLSKATINGETAKIESISSNKKEAVISFEFTSRTTAPTPVKEVAVTVPNPAVGVAPASASQITVNNTSDLYVKSVEWFSDSDRDSAVFESGTTYVAYITVAIKDGVNKVLDLSKATINGSTALVDSVSADQKQAVIAGAFAPAAPAFKDVKQGDWFYPFVSKICAVGQMTGKGDGVFDPSGNLSLAEVMVLASNLHSGQTGKEIPAAEGAWYMKFYSYCQKEGIFDGLNIGEKDLTRSATRFEMVAMLDRAASKDKTSGNINTVKDGFIPDLKESDTHGSVVYRWYRAGILTGDTNHNFNGPKNITRAEVSVILCQLLQLVDRAKI